jgi:hypothetical protein
MLKKQISFPLINYNYWCQKNDYFSNAPLISTIKIGLNHARKGGLIDRIINSSNLVTNKDLVDLIELKIQSHQSVDKFENDELMIIFDLIQGWGGKACRNIYVQPNLNPTRISLTTLPEIYKKAINYCVSGDYQAALNKITSIPNLGESFATKHIFFWSEFGPSRKGLPIYDTRIKTLLFLKNSAAPGYETFLNALNKKAIELSMPPAFVERALFSFSQNYFPNSKLVIKENILDETDIQEGKKLQLIFQNK